MYNLEKSCKETDRPRDPQGRGRITRTIRGYKYWLHHRVIYARYHDVDLEPEDVIRHLCNNPSCIEITHLSMGKNSENVRDQRDAGTHNTVKLTPKQVEKILKMHATKQWRQIEIARKFNVSRSTIGSIVRNETWQPNPEPQEFRGSNKEN